MTEHKEKRAEHAEISPAHHQRELDVPSLEVVLQSTPHEELDWHLGRGVRFRLGPGSEHQASLELYAQVVRVRLPQAELIVPRREPEVAPEGVIFQDPPHFFLSVGPRGDVLFQASAPSPAAEAQAASRLPEPVAPHTLRETRSSPVQSAKKKVKSERYVGRLGEVRTHKTKRGKLVAEVELTVADPVRPGASRLVKFVAFDEKAEALERDFRPGQEATCVGIPHEIQRKGRDGREWSECQLFLVNLPKLRE